MKPTLMTVDRAAELFSMTKDINRYPLWSVLGDKAVAFDRIWAIRIPAGLVSRQTDSEEVRLRAEKVNALIDEATSRMRSSPINLNHLNLGDVSKCGFCMGAGRLLCVECESCNGDGDFYHHDHLYDCKACKGEGIQCFPVISVEGEVCTSCMGSGIAINRLSPVMVGDKHFNQGRLQVLSKMKGLRFYTSEDERVEGVFTFPLKEGGDAFGILMGVRV